MKPNLKLYQLTGFGAYRQINLIIAAKTTCNVIKIAKKNYSKDYEFTVDWCKEIILPSEEGIIDSSEFIE